jgi:phosphatidate cytidylyltransferase
MLSRSLTVLIAAPLVIAMIGLMGPLVFFLLALLVGLTALYEFYAMAMPQAAKAELCGGLLLGALVMTAGYAASVFGSTVITPSGSCIAAFMLIFTGYICLGRRQNVPYERISILFFGIFYIALLFSFLIQIRSLPDGVTLVFFLLFVTWAGDTGAYLTGKTLGKHLLCPRVSPGKTVEGSCGGILFSIAVALVCQMTFLKHISVPHCLAMAAGINVLNQIGDLSESVIKRFCGVKDSGNILPGHGGMLDRIDSLLFAAPFLFYYALFIDASANC